MIPFHLESYVFYAPLAFFIIWYLPGYLDTWGEKSIARVISHIADSLEFTFTSTTVTFQSMNISHSLTYHKHEKLSVLSEWMTQVDEKSEIKNDPGIVRRLFWLKVALCQCCVAFGASNTKAPPAPVVAKLLVVSGLYDTGTGIVPVASPLRPNSVIKATYWV